jgi:hypothetical protein
MRNRYSKEGVSVIIYKMRALLILTLSVAVLLLSGAAFPWEESGHSIQEVLVQRLLLDEDYVFCGTDASWGTNVFGLFVFDRRTGTWTNYPEVKAFPAPSGRVKSISKNEGYVDIQFARGAIRFDLSTGKMEVDEKRIFQSTPPAYSLKIDSRIFVLRSDSIIVFDGTQERTYSPTTPAPVHPVTGKPLKYFGFCSPIVYGDRIYFGCNSDGPGEWTLGLGSFGVDDMTFHFYPSDVFRGQATSNFTWDSSVVFGTACFHYEGNASPAAGFVQFTPSDSTFKTWRGLPLPDYPIAIFCLEQDTAEYWLGTDRGVFRIDKRSGRSIHYEITKGISTRDGVNAYGCYGDLERNQYPVVAELRKGDLVDVLEIYHGWCKIKAPQEIRGFVSSPDVTEVEGEEQPRAVKVKPGALIRADSNPDANVLVRFEVFGNTPEDGYQVTGWSGKAGSARWYEIRVPTAWVHINDLAFSMGEAK